MANSLRHDSFTLVNTKPVRRWRDIISSTRKSLTATNEFMGIISSFSDPISFLEKNKKFVSATMLRQLFHAL